MRRLLVFLILPMAVLRARAQLVEAAAPEAPRIVIPGAPIGGGSAPLIILPSAPALLVPAPPALIIPSAPVILAPAPRIVAAARPLTEEEAAAASLPSQDDLKKIAASLAPAGEAEAPDAANAARARSLGASFDGELAPEASDWEGLSAEFARGPLAPGLPVVETAARSMIARLLPSLYRRVPVTTAFDKSENPANGQTWTPETGHVIRFSPTGPDSRGDVPSEIGIPKPLVQQKIERLIAFAHEYFHVLFDAAVRRDEQYPPQSAYSAMSEGFAVSGEQLLIRRLLDSAPSLGLGPRDAKDLLAMARARRTYLDSSDTKYAEGVISWSKAHDEGGAAGLLEFLSSLSARRMTAVPRSDPAYQLALGEPKLLAAYLGRDETSPARLGLEAFSKAARGERLTEAEAREASAAAVQAGAGGWRRLFERTFFADKSLDDASGPVEKRRWWAESPKPAASVGPAFALARLSPAAGAALARFLADAISSPEGGARLFGRPGSNERLAAILSGAETLPWDQAGRRTWDDGLTRWLTGAR